MSRPEEQKDGEIAPNPFHCKTDGFFVRDSTTMQEFRPPRHPLPCEGDSNITFSGLVAAKKFSATVKERHRFYRDRKKWARKEYGLEEQRCLISNANGDTYIRGIYGLWWVYQNTFVGILMLWEDRKILFRFHVS